MKTRDDALSLLKKYNSQPFLIQHAFTLECVMKHFAEQEGFADEAEFWSQVGLLHDLDYEQYPEEHCHQTPIMLAEHGYDERFIRAVVSHGYTIVNDIKPEHHMEKILFAVDELTGLIGAASLMRPSKSTKDMELRSLKKKYKDKAFAAACSRDVIQQGAELLGWELDELLQRTLSAMQACEDTIRDQIA